MCCYQRKVGDRKKRREKQGRYNSVSEFVFLNRDFWGKRWSIIIYNYNKEF